MICYRCHSKNIAAVEFFNPVGDGKNTMFHCKNCGFNGMINDLEVRKEKLKKIMDRI